MNLKNIREARKAAHKSQDELARHLGINRATVSKYETGVIEPSLSQIIQIAQFLGVRIEDLVGLETFDTGAEFDARRKALLDSPNSYQSASGLHKATGETVIIDHQKERLNAIYDSLDADDRGQLIKHGELLSNQSKYQYPSPEN